MVLEDLKNIKFLLYYIAGYIKDRHLKNYREENISSFLGFGQIVQSLISAIYDSSWDALKMNDNNKPFCTKVFKQFDKKVMVNVLNKKSEKILISKPIDFSNISPLLFLLRLFKKELNKSKYHGKNQKMPNNILKNHTYAQALFRNIEDILKIKDSFFNLLNKKIENIHKTINNTGKMKSHINIIIKDLSCK